MSRCPSNCESPSILYNLNSHIIRNPYPMLVDGSPEAVIGTAGKFDDFQDVPILRVLGIQLYRFLRAHVLNIPHNTPYRSLEPILPRTIHTKKITYLTPIYPIHIHHPKTVAYHSMPVHDRNSTEAAEICCTSSASQAPRTAASCPFPKPRGKPFSLGLTSWGF